MLNKAHIQNLEKCKKYMPSDKDRHNLRISIDKCIPLINFYSHAYEIEKPEDLKYIDYQYANSVLTDYMESKYIDSRLYELQAMKSILKDPSIIDREYKYVKDKPNNHIVYTADIKRSQKCVIINALDEISKLEAYAKSNNITANTNIDHVVIRHENPKYVKNFIQYAINMLKQNTIKDKLLLMLDSQVKMCEDFIKQNEKNSLKSIGKFFEGLGYFDKYLAIYNNQSIKYNFPELKFGLSKDTDSGEIGLKDTFSDEYLDNLSIEELCFLSCFWSNKFAKEWEAFNSAFCAIDSLNLWKDIVEGKTNINIKNDTLDACIRKSNYLNQLTTETFNMLQKDISLTEIKKGTAANLSLTKDYSDYYMQLHNFIGKDYTKFFSSSCLTNNEFIDNISFSSIFVNLKEFAYKKKDAILQPLVRKRLDDNYCKNWGLILNEIVSGQYVDSIDTDRPKVLLGFDIEGFNMPFCFHMLKDNVADLVKLSNSDCLIPEYQGNEDFIVFNKENNTYENIPANIIMPMPKSHKKIIMNHAKTDGENKNFWEHLYFLANGTFPKHLMQTVQKSKKQTISTRKPIVYTNLKTGKRYTKEKNQFVEVDDANVR